MKSKVLAVIMSLCVIMAYVPVFAADDKGIEVSAPEIKGGVSTWDVVYFGYYPQTEIVSDAQQSGISGKAWESEEGYVVNEELYNELSGAEFDNNGDAVLDGIKYKRIKKADAVYTAPSDNYYGWANASEYHYFRYELIKWRVLEVKNDKALLVSDSILDYEKYNESGTYAKWEKSTLRNWLNETFLSRAFSEAEKTAIAAVNQDSVFLLSDSQVYGDNAINYGFSKDKLEADSRKAVASTYAAAKGVYVDKSKNSFWWITDTLDNSEITPYISFSGTVFTEEASMVEQIGIRPAIYLDLKTEVKMCYGDKLSSDGSYDSSKGVHDGQVIKTVEGTCTEDGYDECICKNCGVEYKGNIIKATGHKLEKTDEKEATCLVDGYEKYECSECDYEETVTLKAGGHKYEETEVKATCGEQGYTLHECSKCHDKYKTDIVEATGEHSFDIEVIAPTCTKGGYTIHQCSGCEYNYKDNYTEAGSHDFGITEVAPTCTEEGYTLHKCKNCEQQYKTDITEALGHKYDEGTTTKNPTCEVKGEITYKCIHEGCTDTKTEEIPVLMHEYVESVIAPTCEEKGYDLQKCSKCGHEEKSNFVDALGHILDEGTVTKKATCKEEGETLFKCTREGCSHTEVSVIPMLEHQFDETAIAPTCEEDGYTLHTCSLCGYEYKSDIKEAPGHITSGLENYNYINATYTNPTEYDTHAYCEVCKQYIYIGHFVVPDSMLAIAKAKAPSVKLKKYNQVSVSWEAVPGATGYYVWCKKGTSDWTKKSVKSTGKTFTELSQGTKYQYKVQAYAKDANGNIVNLGKASSVKSITTLKKMSAPKITKSSNGKVKVTWKKMSGVTGYQISQATSKNYTKRVATVGKQSTVSKVLKADAGKKYYYKVRSYKLVNGTKVYSPWSTVKAYTLK